MLPKSATNMAYNLTGLIGFFISLKLLRYSLVQDDVLNNSLWLLLGTAIPILFCEVFFAKCYKNPSSGLNFSQAHPVDLSRLATKLLGLYAIFAGIAFIYFCFPEYHAEFYKPYYSLLQLTVPLLIFFAIPYFYILDRYMTKPEDAYYELGRALLWKRDFGKDNLQVFLAWLVKAFFLPLMFVYFTRDTQFLLNFQVDHILSSFSNAFEFLFHFMFSLDLLFVSIGYMCTFRIFDSQIRSTEPTFLGWGIALVCYQPFWSFFSTNFLSYGSDKTWGYWLSGSPFYYVWGICILLLLAIYLWATVAFGVRFSNLTHRGIITNGPYRFTKHPAYISKNLAWWMLSMPFMVSTNVQDSIRHSALLLFLNLIYFLRAKTEERHLSQDPVYCRYAEYIRLHGVFAFRKKEAPLNLGDMMPEKNY